jgi:cytosine/adenosine deaminase-related metal-dependent hydrolase
VPYADPNELGRRWWAAAADAGIRLSCSPPATCRRARAASLDRSDLGDGNAERWAQRVNALAREPRRSRWWAPQCIPVSAARGPTEPGRGLACIYGAPPHVHSSEQVAEVDQRRAARLHAHGVLPHGVLGPRTNVVHATHLTAEDVTDLRESATGVCFCPTTERDLGDGIGPHPP